MDDFKNFLEENNYKDDLEFQLCDLEMAFNAGKELQWKPSDEQLKQLGKYCPDNTALTALYEQLKKLREK